MRLGPEPPPPRAAADRPHPTTKAPIAEAYGSLPPPLPSPPGDQRHRGAAASNSRTSAIPAGRTDGRAASAEERDGQPRQRPDDYRRTARGEPLPHRHARLDGDENRPRPMVTLVPTADPVVCTAAK
ncbi:hypothetical protein ACGF4C_16875 [Streptomyces sp. NPDC048197]|uniref:hypothetical protein n=1 Tax=Streptomyces sp. NPDC048197 TaxID=3365511 RepID=UPI003719155B